MFPFHKTSETLNSLTKLNRGIGEATGTNPISVKRNSERVSRRKEKAVTFPRINTPDTNKLPSTSYIFSCAPVSFHLGKNDFFSRYIIFTSELYTFAIFQTPLLRAPLINLWPAHAFIADFTLMWISQGSKWGVKFPQSSSFQYWIIYKEKIRGISMYIHI